ncbi:hypothetical protein FYK55_01115 [Roseiconus nitratireducens]|uniref:VWFA domain-containing protein n=1 Tax=Roseiconus nitratireducens TaxID=2605748 RepID=A0A5M6DHM7_9BACT|nr:hypothetical protein [Roseiconus nitratireducens]KAA5547048.1 hypothetical protein FYK55_01115 [Roseiconus nitratireducens]
MLLSLALHTVLLVAIAYFAAIAPRGTGEAPDRQIGIAMVHRLPDREQYEEVTPQTSESATQNAQENASDLAAAAAPPSDLSPPLDLQGVLAAMESTPAPRSGSGIAGDTELGGDAFGSGERSAQNTPIGEQATTRLFGVSGSGSRFVYVFDRSDSMNGFGGLPLRSAKRELIRSLQSLSPQQQFQIIFYNENVKPFQLAGTPLQMVSGEPNSLNRAERYIESIRAFGGTKHKAALLMALRMSPDVIFFLTDAHIPRLSQSELKLVQSRAEQAGTTIHAIEFGSKPVGSADSFLRSLAEMNNGQYQYVDIRRLGDRGAGTPAEDTSGESESAGSESDARGSSDTTSTGTASREHGDSETP